ncbi:hypothetical protein GCM10023194_00410 [Planotetraspora phitsanulokensis]|uniref:Lipoprotein n=1 Tax=Planotetraspora phitsanulokensis TaxID=575192 RepID=A0A8J3XFU0_9ACTN|nr:hypothetical protein [Planotetraspora phitsanulokensis]GII40072.1 hypothetical protein Pph01_50750 [Planotetraspora phitsanulokensis]
MHGKTTAIAVLLLAMLSGCGHADARRTQAGPGTPAQRALQAESMRADCMRDRGFRYIPYVAPAREKTTDELREEAGDYEAMKRFRQRNGYGVFAFYVYPQEFGNPLVPPDRPLPPDPDPDPNHRLMAALSRTQFGAYQDADTACYLRAVNDVYGKDVTSISDQVDQANAQVAESARSTLDRDPRIAERAGAMAACLESRGHRIGSKLPTDMADRGRRAFEAIKRPMGTRIPDDVREEMDQPAGALFEPDLSIEQARPYLDREIRDALDDLECGRDFYPLFQPRKTEIDSRVYEEFGLTPLS